MSMSERELGKIEGVVRLEGRLYNSTIRNLISEVRRSHTEAAEANESLSLIYDHVTRGRISKPNTPVREVMTLADDLERDYADQEVAERTKELETEAAELRKRVGGLEGALAKLKNFLEVTAAYAVSKPKRDYAEFILKQLHADLSQAKLENQRTE